ncbi:uncharacterized protein LOC132285150 isoform X2 [Cornus florida]|uniref:uncharacterized protein LOC132285150 isoform X2 n=1 Tax=Cornus florida TaxID=4283 RepID=UPI0028A09296|nr:uncharacterized protein LOC132285150 isoform X2 [Cornus florida]
MEEEDERREAAIASAPSLQPNFRPVGVTQSQLTKFQEYLTSLANLIGNTSMAKNSQMKIQVKQLTILVFPSQKGTTLEISPPCSRTMLQCRLHQRSAKSYIGGLTQRKGGKERRTCSDNTM